VSPNRKIISNLSPGLALPAREGQPAGSVQGSPNSARSGAIQVRTVQSGAYGTRPVASGPRGRIIKALTSRSHGRSGRSLSGPAFSASLRCRRRSRASSVRPAGSLVVSGLKDHVGGSRGELTCDKERETDDAVLARAVAPTHATSHDVPTIMSSADTVKWASTSAARRDGANSRRGWRFPCVKRLRRANATRTRQGHGHCLSHNRE
jgi:hypothetical protein